MSAESTRSLPQRYRFLCCPETGSPLEQLEPWLLSDADGEGLYPVLCNTPVLMPHVDEFLLDETVLVERAMTEFGVDLEAKDWFLSRYARFNAPDPSVVDSEVVGEGYEGFWDALELPDMLTSLTKTPPETQIEEWMAGHRFGQVLDVGCGQGGMTQRMGKQAAWVWGLESNFYLAALANRLLPEPSLQIGFHDPQSGWCRRVLPKTPLDRATVICGSLDAPPFQPSTFDWVHCGHVFDLLDDPEEGLLNLVRLMKPNAWLTICSPLDFPRAGHFDGLMALLDTLFVKHREKDHHPWLRFHHKRRAILHVDWLWVGQLRSEASNHIG